MEDKKGEEVEEDEGKKTKGRKETEEKGRRLNE